LTSKLALYNDALLHISEERLASLTESRAPRRALDDAYDTTLRYCLEAGFWNFAMRAVQADSSASVTPTFGYSFAFTKPDDIIRTLSMSSEATMKSPLLDIVDEPNYWYANVDPLYVKYVSSDTAYGLDLSIWPETFADYVAKRLAVKICKRVTGKDPDESLLRAENRARADARSKDAMNEPPGFMPRGTWAMSRGGGGSGSRWDGSFQ